MTSERDRELTIFFIDGSKLSFAFPQQADRHQVVRRMEELLKNETLKIEADGVLFLFPLSSIKYVQAIPAPDSLGDGVISGASVVS